MEYDRHPTKLSPRELELIRFASEGLTDTAIALRLGISEATVGTYWGRVRIKIGPYNRTELVSIFLRARQEDELRKLRDENAQQVAELRRISESAGAGSLFEQILENAPDAMLVVSESGMITTANGAAHELFGYEPGTLNGVELPTLIPERFRDLHRMHQQEYTDEPQRRVMGNHLQTPAVRRDGSEIVVRAALSAMRTPTGLLVTCTLRQAFASLETIT